MGSACSAVGFTMHYWYGRPEVLQHSSDGSHQYELVAPTTASKTADTEAHTSKVVLEMHQHRRGKEWRDSDGSTWR
jgi:hypothetical protein